MLGIDLRPHQDDCVGAICAELTGNDRATLIMPCGTGKTVVACSLAEKLAPDVCVLLEPSLELVGQTLRVWKSLQPLGADALLVAVCSQDDVGTDGTALEASPDIEVTLDAGRLLVLAENARASGRKLVVVGTYHSSALIAQAAQAGLGVDLMVFDEAHRTAVNSRKGVFTACLSDDDCPTGKRVFMTATPRHIASNDDANSFSMDDVSVYGKYAHVLSLSDAIARGLVADYRVVVAAVHEEEIPEHIRNSKSHADILAAAWAIALDKCVRELGVKKAITFHDTVATAKSFAASTELQATWAVTSHINGKMPMGVRRGMLQAFSDTAENALTTNVRCLSEGIDVPAVDLVGFMSPRGSLTDVVQAVGRSMRVADGKTAGYVLLPIMVTKEDAGDVKAALRRSDMGFIWEVLATLRDMSMPIHHKSLTTSKAQRIATDVEIEEAREHFKSAFMFLGTDELNAKLREAIELVHVDGMRTEWEKGYLWVKDYSEKHGTFHLPYGSDENKQKGKFLANARLTYRLGKMSDRIKGLWNEIGFPWDGDAEKLRTQEMHKQAAASKEAARLGADEERKRIAKVLADTARRGWDLSQQHEPADPISESGQDLEGANPYRLMYKPRQPSYLDVKHIVKQLRVHLKQALGAAHYEVVERQAKIHGQNIKTFSIGSFDNGGNGKFWTPTSEEMCFRLEMDDRLAGVPWGCGSAYRTKNRVIKEGDAVDIVLNVFEPLNKAIMLVVGDSLPLDLKTLLIKAVGHEFLLSPAAADVVKEAFFTAGVERFQQILDTGRMSGDFKSLRRCGHDAAMGKECASPNILSETQRGWWFLSHRMEDWNNANGFGYIDSDLRASGPVDNFEGWRQITPFDHHSVDATEHEDPCETSAPAM